MSAMGYAYLGDFSATPPWYSIAMSCDDCKVSWTGCWDNYQCPKCGKGELPYLTALTSDDGAKS